MTPDATSGVRPGGSSREDFLGRLRERLAAGGGAPHGAATADPAAPPGTSEPAGAAPPAPRARFVAPRGGTEGFSEAWQALGGTVEEISAADLRRAVAAYAERHPGPVLATDGLDVDADLVWPHCGTEAAAGASVGVVRAAGAAAQTGTVLLRADHNAGRAAGLLPGACVFVIDADTVADTLGDFLRLPRGPGDLPSQLVAVTGPSRSADIESTLVIGVHGPGDVHAILTR